MSVDVKDQIREIAENDLEAKVCTNCKELKPLTFYGKRSPRLYHSWCKSCQNTWAKENYNYEKVRNNALIRQYGINSEDYDRMRKEQNYCCAICGVHEASAIKGQLHVDHCHKSGKVRKLLCVKCNTVLGKVNDDPLILEKMIEYLR